MGKWYQQNKRNLPWRKTNDPYVIWISEIVFQQTRIQQGIAYFQRFIDRFPTVLDLAESAEEEVLKIWQGLGYYSRARNLHHTAKTIANVYNGRFPDTFEEVIQLKGVGEYTASAILSIAFEKPFAVVDGNVARVLSRIYGIREPINSPAGKKILAAKAHDIMDKKNPGDHNQAMMEFGALFCVPVNPDCGNCIFADQCFAYQNKRVDKLPVKVAVTKIVNRYIHYFVLLHTHNETSYIFLNKRNEKDIWQHLYDFPHVETEKQINLKKASVRFYENFGFYPQIRKEVVKDYRHILTHRIIHGRFYRMEIDDIVPEEKLRILDEKYLRIPVASID
ncbi:MAG: A/G-specific adenine glycosylase, partial [Bacteroidales bacterium]|nr:A/G-specific adenine glycosylase [Bacteroidales bacterium]